MVDIMYADIDGVAGIISISVSTSHSAQSSIAIIEVVETTLDIGDSISIDLGYVGDHGKVFQGYVKNIEFKEPSLTFTITASDVLVRAMDFFIASTNPEEPFTRQNINAEDLVGDVLALAGITNYEAQNSAFTLALSAPLEVNLTTAYDYCRFIADIIAFHLYADEDGVVHFLDRRFFPMGGDNSIGTVNKIISVSAKYTESDRDLRNRVVVYGAGGIFAEASEESPYLPDGFFKSVVVSAPQVFDTQEMAEQSAEYNLELLNRLTISASIVMRGDHRYLARKVATFSFTEIGISGDWYIFSAEHSFNNAGYTVSMELRK